MPARPPRPPRRSRFQRQTAIAHDPTGTGLAIRVAFAYRPQQEDQKYRWWVDQQFYIHSPDRLPTKAYELDDKPDSEPDNEHIEPLRIDVAALQQGDELSMLDPLDPDCSDASRSVDAIGEPMDEAFKQLLPWSPQAARDPIGTLATFLATLQGIRPVADLPEGASRGTSDGHRAKSRRAAPTLVRGYPSPPLYIVLDMVLTQCVSEAIGYLGVRMMRAFTKVSGVFRTSGETMHTVDDWMTPTNCVVSLDALLHLMQGVDGDPIWNEAEISATPEALQKVWDTLRELSRVMVSGMVTLPAQGVQRERREQPSAPLVRIVDTNLHLDIRDGEGLKRAASRTPTWVHLEVPCGSWLWRTLV